MVTYVAIWAALLVAVIAIEAIRRYTARDEDDSLHVRDCEVQMVARQRTLAHSLEVIDRWRVWLFVVTLVYGVALAGAWVYSTWQAGSRIAY